MLLNNSQKILLVGTLISVIAMVLWLKPGTHDTGQATPISTSGLPRLVDLGATTCVPCIQMAPILDQLGTEFSGRFEVEFIDVWKNPEALEPYQIKAIPTQIFYDENGSELFRHVGFFGRKQILRQWRKLGYTFAERAPASASAE